MKKIIEILGLIICITQIGYSQNWELFPLNQKSFFKISFNNQPDIIEEFYIDSVQNINNSIKAYFYTSYTKVSNCNLFNIFPFNSSYYRPDLIETRNDTSFCKCGTSNNSNFIFMNKANQSQSWNISVPNYNIICDSIRTAIIFGITDSVKYFSIQSPSPNPYLANKKLVLSKNFGLIEFVPFCQIMYSNPYDMGIAKIIGFEKNNQVNGFTQPKFHDYFHLSVGDILFWKYENNNDNLQDPDLSYIYKDSLTTIITTTDSIIYNVNRINDYYGVTQATYKFYKNKYDGFINLPTNWTTFDSEIPFDYMSFSNPLAWRSDDLNYTNNVTTKNFYFDGTILDTFNCSENHFYDLGYSFSLNTKVGLSEYCTYNFGSTCNTVIGSIINGQLEGETYIRLISSSQNQNVVLIENPVNKFLRLNFENNGNISYKISTMQGFQVKNGLLHKNESSINIENLKTGLYILQLIKNNERINIKFAKI